MTPIEAYELTMSMVSDIRNKGTKVSLYESKSKEEDDLVSRFGGPERIPPSKWTRVTFYPSTKEQGNEILERAIELAKLGINFDTGSLDDRIDWELDWSFSYSESGKEENIERKTLLKTILSGNNYN